MDIPASLYRCIECGIESGEATCFVGISTAGLQRYPVKCITCSQPNESRGNSRGILDIVGILFVPLVLIIALEGGSNVSFLRLLLAAPVIQPLLVILHELGHFLTGRLLGLEPSLIRLGVGRKLWGGTILSVPLRIHGWPSSGFTYLGSRSMRFLRLRIWLTTLMGPATNLLLIAPAAAFWNPLARVVGANVVLFWIVLNALLATVSLLPHRIRRSGQWLQSDGLQLLQIPFKKRSELAIYLVATPILSALDLYRDSDYAGARDICLKGLERFPGNQWLSVTFSACQISLGDYDAAMATLNPLLEPATTEAPEVRAAVLNNLAIAIWLRDIHTDSREQSSARADELSDRAFRMYPCVLPYRSSRALLLVATNRPDQALKLLEYSNYDRGSAADRADHQIARAFALRRLNRREEADQAIAAGLQLNKTRQPWVATLGLLPPASTPSLHQA
jgi:tetratricopeptide (TPR) repeat protein